MSSPSHRPNALLAELRQRRSAVLAALGDGLVDVSTVLADEGEACDGLPVRCVLMAGWGWSPERCGVVLTRLGVWDWRDAATRDLSPRVRARLARFACAYDAELAGAAERAYEAQAAAVVATMRGDHAKRDAG